MITSSSFRLYTDGLRAIAILAVLVHQLSAPLMPGGYVGVAVFFVVFGYPISSIISRKTTDGTFTFVRFYERWTATVMATPATISPLWPTPCRLTCWLPPIPGPKGATKVHNLSVGDCTTLNDLFKLICDNLSAHGVDPNTQPVYRDFRADDVWHSLADVSKAYESLDCAPTHYLAHGVASALPSYVAQCR